LAESILLPHARRNRNPSHSSTGRSGDLSHYLEYAAARSVDASTAQSILNCSTELGSEQACGCVGINGLMRVARERELEVRLLDLRNSGDTAAERARVVGYGAFALYEARVGR
jgi:MEMO1 family protein